MEQYIDKAALVAEIAKEKSSIEDRINSSTEDGYRRAKNITYLNAQYLLCQRLESFLDTLEVKEVDLETELNKWRHNHFHGRRDKDASGEYLERISQLELAKHFFELGLKAQKGE